MALTLVPDLTRMAPLTGLFAPEDGPDPDQARMIVVESTMQHRGSIASEDKLYRLVQHTFDAIPESFVSELFRDLLAARARIDRPGVVDAVNQFIAVDREYRLAHDPLAQPLEG